MAQVELVKHSDLLNQLIIDRTQMEELGRVEVLWEYPPAHKVLGFIGKSGFLGNKKSAFNLTQIHTFGEESILVSSKPQATDAEKVRQLESLIHCEVWSDAGTKIGKIVDYRFHLKTGTIQDYLFVTSELSALTDGVYLLPPSKILSLGRRRVLVAEKAVQSLQVYREGIRQKIRKAEEAIKGEAEELKSRSLSLTESLTKRAQNATQQARERARRLTEQAREKAQSLNEQLKEGTQTLADQVKETSQGWVEQVKEQTDLIRDQLSIAEEAEDWEDEPTSPNAPSAKDLDDFDAIFEDWDDPTRPAPSVDSTIAPPPPPESRSTQPEIAKPEIEQPETAQPVRAEVVQPELVKSTVQSTIAEEPDPWDVWDEEPVAIDVSSAPVEPAIAPADAGNSEPADLQKPELGTQNFPEQSSPVDFQAYVSAESSTGSSTENPTDNSEGGNDRTDRSNRTSNTDDEDEPWV